MFSLCVENGIKGVQTGEIFCKIFIRNLNQQHMLLLTKSPGSISNSGGASSEKSNKSGGEAFVNVNVNNM